MTDRLYRSRTERVLFGVAGGVAERLAVDPALVRIVWVLMAFAGGFGVLLYIIMAFVVPEAPMGAMPGSPTADGDGAGDGAGAAGSAWGTSTRPRARDDGRGVMFFGLILVIGGAWFLARRWLTFLDSDLIGPIALIALGAVLLIGAMRRSGGGEG